MRKRIEIPGAGWTYHEAHDADALLSRGCLIATVVLALAVYVGGWLMLGAPGGAWGWARPGTWW